MSIFFFSTVFESIDGYFDIFCVCTEYMSTHFETFIYKI